MLKLKSVLFFEEELETLHEVRGPLDKFADAGCKCGFHIVKKQLQRIASK